MKLTAMLMGIAIATGVASGAAAEPLARTEAGTLRGERGPGGGTVFRGVPFAAPPVGPLRWRGPQPVPAWSGTRDALAFGPSCPQNPFPGDDQPAAGSFAEDCLYLNIWTPPGAELTAAAKLPVLVSIHGGGLVNGGAAGPVFDGAALARRGIVVVTINYRLGRLGFFGHPALAAEGGDAAAVNFGYLDQVAALRWVQRNIAAFGGDPARVTIAGESAGGASVQMLMISPQARGLFSAAIAQSAPARLDFKPPEAATKAGATFAKAAGVTGNDAAALRAIPLAKVLEGVSFFQQNPENYSGPVTDGGLIPYPVMAGFIAGCQARVPYMVGGTGLELGALPGIFAVAGFDKLPEADRKTLLAVYDPKGNRKRDEVATEALSDQAFAEPARATARLAAAAGQPVWVYRFDYVAQHKRAGQRGAFHASEVTYTFDTLGLTDPKASAEDIAAAGRVADYWANFVKHHDPNGPSLPAWPQAGADGETILTFGAGGPAAGRDPWRARLDVLEGLAKPAAAPASSCKANP